MKERTIQAGALPIALLAALILALPVSAKQAGQQSQTRKASEAASRTEPVQLRDPFRPLVGGPEGEAEDVQLPPGNRGLVIGRLTVKGVVNGPEGMIAVVEMHGRNRAYFLREGEEVYNGRVRRITEDGVVFSEKTKDAYGAELEREVTKQISGSGAMR